VARSLLDPEGPAHRAGHEAPQLGPAVHRQRLHHQGVDVDPAASDRPGTIYIIEIDGVRHDLAESWVLPWMRGLAIRNGIADQAVCDPSAAERAQRVQALMVGHQFGLFTYTGFTTHKKEATT